MIWIGKNFVVVSEGKNQAEAEYRYALTRIRENGESIALLGGEEEERAGIDRAFGTVVRRWVQICGQHMRTTVVSHGSSIIAPVIPILLAAPKYLDGTMSLGQVMQAASAFTIVQSAFGWLVDNYPRLAEWTAGARRIAALMVSLDALEKAEAGEGTGRIDARRDKIRAQAERPVGDAGRRHGRRQRRRGHDRARRAGAGRGQIRHRQEHAGARDCRPLAVGQGERRIPHDGASSCCRRSPMSPQVRCGGRSPIPRRPRTGMTTDRRGAGQRRARASEGQDRGRSAVGPDAVRRRKAAPRLRARAAAQARYPRAR